MSAGAKNSPIHRRSRRRLIAAILLAAALVVPGCKSPDWKGDGFHDDMARWGERQRPPDQPDGSSEMLGLSAKSQQIERNLGVR